MECKSKKRKGGEMRKFNTGGTRDDCDNKPDFESFLSPLVIQKYAEYMHKNRKMKDGTIRDGDNWQKGFGDKHYDVCMKSLWRHFFDMWMEHRGNNSREGLESAINGILFNTMAYYHQYLKEKGGKDE